MMYFIQGLTIGFAYVAPIGLQNLFVINTALTQKKSRVYMTALIVIFFDITLALACFFGMGAIMQSSEWLELAILFIGSLIVIWIGISLLRAHDTVDTSTKVDVPLLKVITTACVVTWFNPQALIDGSMMLGAFRTTLPAGEAAKFIIGVNCSSCIWFLGISTLISKFSAKFNDKVLRIINVVCGLIIIFYGAKLFINFIQMILPML
ncbi:MAG: LysE family transporter [Anaerovoracaceae bacterium]